MNNFNYEMIESYLAGELQGEELQAFTKELQTNEALASEVLLYDSIQKDMIQNHQTSLGTEKLRQSTSTLNKEYFKKQTASVVPMRRWLYLAAAAAVACLLLLNNPFTKETNESLFAANSKEIPALTTVRGNADDNTAAIALYNQKDFTAAIPKLELQLTKNAADNELLLALGVSYTKTNAGVKAIATLDKLIAKNNAYQDEAKWWKALAQIQDKNNGAAVETLNSISNASDKKQQVDKLMKALSKLK